MNQKKLTILKWMFAILFLIIGAAMFSAYTLSGIIYIVLALFILPITHKPVIKKVRINRFFKYVVVIGLIVIGLLPAIIIDAGKQKEIDKIAIEAEELINEGKLDEAKKLLIDAQGKYSLINKNVESLQASVDALTDEALIKSSILSLTDDEFRKLKKGELNKTFNKLEKLNTLFIEILRQNSDRRADYLDEEEKKKIERAAKIERDKLTAEQANAKKAEEARKAKIEMQFSADDGSHRKLEAAVKKTLNDPDSYEHDETSYRDMETHIIVLMKYRARNGFGGMVRAWVKAKMTLDGDLIEVIEQS